MIAYFCSLEWKEGKAEFIERKPKEKKPSSLAKMYKQKTDGSIVWMVPSKAKYVLTVKSEDGKLYTEDVYSYLKDVSRNTRITKKLREDFESFMKNQNFTVSERGYIEGLYQTVNLFFMENR